jgi:hypothetical protein
MSNGSSYFGSANHMRARCMQAGAEAAAVRDGSLNGRGQLTAKRFPGLCAHECHYFDRFIFIAQRHSHPLSSDRVN